MRIGISFGLIFGCFSFVFSQQPEIQQKNPTLEHQPTVNQIVVPLEIDLTKYINEAQKQVPSVLKGSDNPCSGVRYYYEFYKGKMSVVANQQTITTTLDGSYWIKMNYCPTCTSMFGGEQKCISPLIPFSCGINETKPSVKIGLSTYISVTKDYTVSSSTTVQKVEPINPCKVTVFSFDATGAVMKQVRKAVQEAAYNLDKNLATISFKNEAADLWKQLNKSFAIQGLGYLHVLPIKISLVKPHFANNKLYTSLILDCKTFLNQSNTTSSTTNMPKLEIVSSTPKDEFSISTDFQLSYDSLTNLLMQQMGGKMMEIKKKQIVFDQFEVKGMTDNRILISIHFSGAKKGTLNIYGQPTFSNFTKVFSLENLDYGLKSKSWLLKMADAFFPKKITDELRKATTIDMKPNIEALKTTINKSLEQKIGEYQLHGRLENVFVDAIETGVTHLFLRTTINARLKITN